MLEKRVVFLSVFEKGMGKDVKEVQLMGDDNLINL